LNSCTNIVSRIFFCISYVYSFWSLLFMEFGVTRSLEARSLAALPAFKNKKSVQKALQEFCGSFFTIKTPCCPISRFIIFIFSNSSIVLTNDFSNYFVSRQFKCIVVGSAQLARRVPGRLKTELHTNRVFIIHEPSNFLLLGCLILESSSFCFEHLFL